MSRARDDARRNMRREFATVRDDGTPVGSYTITYQDYCTESFDGYGKCFTATIGGPAHVPGSHTRGNWWIKGPYREPAYDDDYGYDDWDVAS